MNSPDTPHTDAADLDVARRDAGPTPPPEESLRRGFETRDVNARALLWLAASVGAVVGLSLLVLWFLLAELQIEAREADPELSPLALSPRPPPPPRLQNTPMRDFAEYHDEQEAELKAYGWVDREKGVVHIPIRRAMDLALERGLPSPKGQSPENPPSEKAEEDAEK